MKKLFSKGSSLMALVGAAMAMGSLPQIADAEILNFEHIALPSSTYQLLGNYAGFIWDTNSYFFNPAGGSYVDTGYYRGVISGQNIGFNGSGSPMSFWRTDKAFNLRSGYFTSAWNENNLVTIRGVRWDDTVIEAVFSTNTQSPILWTFDGFTNLQWIGISTSSSQVAFDDLVYDFGDMSDIDTSRPYWLFTEVDSVVRPVFRGGTLRINVANAAADDDVQADDSHTNTLDLYGNNFNYTGDIKAYLGSVGYLQIVDSIGGGHFAYGGDVGSETQRFDTLVNRAEFNLNSGAEIWVNSLQNLGRYMTDASDGMVPEDGVPPSGNFVNDGKVYATETTNDGTITNNNLWYGNLTNNSSGVADNNFYWEGRVYNYGQFNLRGTQIGNIYNYDYVTASGTIRGSATGFDNSVFDVVGSLEFQTQNMDPANETMVPSDAPGSEIYLRDNAQLKLLDGTIIGLDNLINQSSNSRGIFVSTNSKLNAQNISNDAYSTIYNEGRIFGNLANSGNFYTLGSYFGTLANADYGRVYAQGSHSGDVRNSGYFRTSGYLAGSRGSTIVSDGEVRAEISETLSNFYNTGNGLLFVANGDYVGLGAVTNSSNRTYGIEIGEGRILSGQSLDNFAGAGVLNFGTLQFSSGIRNEGNIVSYGKTYGPIVNAVGGNFFATSIAGGNVANYGRFDAAGTLSLGDYTFTNHVGGRLNLVDYRMLITGEGARPEADSFNTLSAGRFDNYSTVDMRNLIAGDSLKVNGPYNAFTGAALYLDVGMGSNGGKADSLIANSTSGTTKVFFQNVDTNKVYFTNPLVLIRSTSGSGAFIAGDDANTIAALRNKGLITYKFTQLSGTNNWGIVSTLNTAAVNSVSSETAALATTIGHSIFPENSEFVFGTKVGAKYSHNFWVRLNSGVDEYDTDNKVLDGYSPLEHSIAELNHKNAAVGYNGKVKLDDKSELKFGLGGGQLEANSENSKTKYSSEFRLPYYGGFIGFNSGGFGIDLESYHFDGNVTPDAKVSRQDSKLAGNYGKLKLSYGAKLGNNELLGFASFAKTSLTPNAIVLNENIGSVVFDKQVSQLTQVGAKLTSKYETQNLIIKPYGALSVFNEAEKTADAKFVPTDVGSEIGLEASRVGIFGQVELGANIEMKRNGAEFYAGIDYKEGENFKGSAAKLGVRVKF